MLRILGSKKVFCDGLTRRDWLQIGGLGMLGVGLDDVLRLRELQASPTTKDSSFGKAKSCILLLPYGSPPQHETFEGGRPRQTKSLEDQHGARRLCYRFRYSSKPGLSSHPISIPYLDPLVAKTP